MKKWLLMVVAAVFCAWNVQAQTEKGAMAAGVNLTVGFGDSYTNVGLGAKYQYNIIDNLRLEPNFNYYFKKDYLSMWDLSVNVHYLFTLYEGLNFYPLAGIGVAGGKAEDEPLGERGDQPVQQHRQEVEQGIQRRQSGSWPPGSAASVP